jgi:hypothetical protein
VSSITGTSGGSAVNIWSRRRQRPHLAGIRRIATARMASNRRIRAVCASTSAAPEPQMAHRCKFGPVMAQLPSSGSLTKQSLDLPSTISQSSSLGRFLSCATHNRMLFAGFAQNPYVQPDFLVILRMLLLRSSCYNGTPKLSKRLGDIRYVCNLSVRVRSGHPESAYPSCEFAVEK